jgi:uncharacterized DUF497 family protein
LEIEFDAAKDEINRAKHGISLSEAARLDWDVMWTQPDLRREYGEDRQIGYALLGERVYCVVFTPRDAAMRIISLRKANNREMETYESQA